MRHDFRGASDNATVDIESTLWRARTDAHYMRLLPEILNSMSPAGSTAQRLPFAWLEEEDWRRGHEARGGGLRGYEA